MPVSVRLGQVHVDYVARYAKFLAASRGVKGAVRQQEESMKRLKAELKRFNQVARASRGRLFSLQGAFRLLAGSTGVALLVRRFVNLGDELVRLQAQIRIVTFSERNLLRVQQQLLNISQETRTGLAASITLFTRLARSTQSAGIAQDRLLAVTRGINQSLKIGGATTAEATAGVIQFSQGLASSRLSGDEMRSVLEQMPRLALALADALKIGVGKLREFGKAGLLTTEVVLPALESQLETIREEYLLIPRTVADAITQFKNQALVVVGGATVTSGAIKQISESIDRLRLVVQREDVLASFVSSLVTAVEVSRFLIRNFHIVGRVLKLLFIGELLQRVYAFRVGGLAVAAAWATARVQIAKIGPQARATFLAATIASVRFRTAVTAVVAGVERARLSLDLLRRSSIAGAVAVNTLRIGFIGFNFVLRNTAKLIRFTLRLLKPLLIAQAVFSGIEFNIRFISGLQEGKGALESFGEAASATVKSLKSIFVLGEELGEIPGFDEFEPPDLSAVQDALNESSDAAERTAGFMAKIREELHLQNVALEQGARLIGLQGSELARVRAENGVLIDFERERYRLQLAVTRARATERDVQRQYGTQEEQRLKAFSQLEGRRASIRRTSYSDSASYLAALEDLDEAFTASVTKQLEVTKALAVAASDRTKEEAEALAAFLAQGPAVNAVAKALGEVAAQAARRAEAEREREQAAADEVARIQEQKRAYESLAAALAPVRARSLSRELQSDLETRIRLREQEIHLQGLSAVEAARQGVAFDVANQFLEREEELQGQVFAAVVALTAARLSGNQAAIAASERHLRVLREETGLLAAQKGELADLQVRYGELAAAAAAAGVEAQRTAEHQREIARIANRVGRSFEQLGVSITRNFRGIGDAVRRLVDTLLSELLRVVLFRKIATGVSTFVEGLLNGGGGGSAPATNIGGAQAGGYRRGLTLVGEAGPEIVDFREAGRVYSNDVLRDIVSGGGGTNITFAPVINTTDTAAVRRVLYEEAYPLFKRDIEATMDRRLSEPGRTRRLARGA